MIADIDLKHYYVKFQAEAKDVKEKVDKDLEIAIEVRDKHRDIIDKKKRYIYGAYGIDLDNYPELKDNIVDKDLKLQVIKLYRDDENPNGTSSVLYYLYTYLNDVKRVYILSKKKIEIDRRVNLSFSEYKTIVYNYYRYTVHKCLLEGFMYDIADESIEFLINRYKTDNCKPGKKIVDLKATSAKLKEIKEKGLIPYNKEDAEIAKVRNIKYEGVPYIVYRFDKFYYKLEINIRTNRKTYIDFKRFDRIHDSIRGMTQSEVAEQCVSKEQIYSLKCDIHHKLKILLNYDNMAYLNFIRNAEQDKFTNGIYNRQNRQRFQSR